MSTPILPHRSVLLPRLPGLSHPVVSPAGTALVVILSFIVLLSVLLTAFLSRAVLNRQIAFSSAGQFRAEQTTRAGLNTLLGDLQEEIQAGSRTGPQYSVGGVNVYCPRTDPLGSKTAAAPVRIGEVRSLKTLLRRSVSAPAGMAAESFPPDESNQPVFASSVYDTNLVPRNRASAVSSQIASPNGHVIPAARWNKPALLVQTRLNDGTVTIPNFAVPDWCLLTRGGPKAFGGWADSLKNSTLATTSGNTLNPDYVLGRYAYTVYDEGALLDVNLTGYPSDVNSQSVDANMRSASGKFAPYYADLRQVGDTGSGGLLTTTQVDNFVHWRNASRLGDPSAFVDFANNFAPKLGFIGVFAGSPPAPSDQALVSRQDLLGYAKASNWDQNALQSLGTFSREINSPTFSPATPTGTNPNFALAFVGGKPIRRFPLNTNLQMLEMVTGPDDKNTANLAQVKALFGLVPASDFVNPDHRHWNYVDSGIQSWDAVLGGKRAPNFFELLKAAIGQDSLGRAYKPTFLDERETSGQPADTVYPPDNLPDDQIIRIGANILDQHDADSYPTLVTFNGESFWGIENLPYFSELFVQMYRQGASSDPNHASQHYIYFELWNPHQPDLVKGKGPASVRVNVNSAANYTMHYWYWNGSYAEEYDATNPGGPQSFPSYALDCLPLSTEDFREPKIISNPGGGGWTAIGDSSASLNAYKFPVSGFTEIPPTTNGKKQHWYNDRFIIDAAVFRLEYRADDGTWYPYNTFGGYYQDGGRGDTGLQHDGEPVMGPNDPGSTTTIPLPSAGIPKPDPRTFRYGASMCYDFNSNGDYGAPPAGNAVNKGMVPAAASGEIVGNNNGPGNGGDLSNYNGSSHPGMLFVNTATGGTYTQGNDGKTIRQADGGLGSFVTADSAGNGYATTNPMHAGNMAARPVILNRAFRSVGELGYTFRDEPWKTLDFFSANSADAALLDVFCLDDTETVAGRVDLTALNDNAADLSGKVNPTMLKSDALRVLLSGALRQEATTSTTITGIDPGNIVAALATVSLKHPVTNKADLVTQLSTQDVNAAFPAIKSQREAVARALGQNTSTRTWNLLIDMVAQVGHYPTSATGLSQFIVEGEKRCWMHVALDRYTGAVVQQSLEQVDE